MLDQGVFQHVTRDHAFKNAALFYRFASHEKSHGRVPANEDGSRVSWADLFGGSVSVDEGPCPQAKPAALTRPADVPTRRGPPADTAAPVHG